MAPPSPSRLSNLPLIRTIGLRARSTQTQPSSSGKIQIVAEPASTAPDRISAQRKNRPVAPHLKIYDPAQTWLGASIWTRISGSVFSVGLYAFGAGYLVLPWLGLGGLDSGTVVAAAAGLPVAAKMGLKFLVGWPFVFHALNGTRHLVWDTAKGFDLKTIARTSWVIWGVSLIVSLGMAGWT